MSAGGPSGIDHPQYFSAAQALVNNIWTTIPSTTPSLVSRVSGNDISNIQRFRLVTCHKSMVSGRALIELCPCLLRLPAVIDEEIPIFICFRPESPSDEVFLQFKGPCLFLEKRKKSEKKATGRKLRGCYRSKLRPSFSPLSARMTRREPRGF